MSKSERSSVICAQGKSHRCKKRSKNNFKNVKERKNVTRIKKRLQTLNKKRYQ